MRTFDMYDILKQSKRIKAFYMYEYCKAVLLL